MILTDFLEVGGEPTLWIWIGSATDFRDLCLLLSRLVEGEVNFAKASSLPKLFKLLPGISEFILAVVIPPETDEVKVIISKDRQIVWKLPSEGWRSTLQWLNTLSPNRHNYIEYPEATVHVSYMERLRSTVGASDPSKDIIKT